MLLQLINTALLGTDKIGFDEKLLPESIRIIVEKMSDTDKEARFLKTAALLAFYEESGQKPKRFVGEFPIENQHNNAVVSPQKFAAILNEILEMPYNLRNDLLALWLDKLIEREQVCTAKSTVSLLILAESLPKKFHSKIIKVLSKKGLDLLTFKTSITLKELASEEQIWKEGKLAERRELFIELRNEHPQKALSLLETTWKEESLNDKRAFIETIKTTFQLSDVAFLESIIPEFTFKIKERKTQREIRVIIKGLLMGIVDTDTYIYTTKALEIYFNHEKAKGIMGWAGKKNIVISLSNDDDSFMNISMMESEYGFEVSPDIAIFTTNQHYWLACFLEYLPFDFWINHLEKDLEATVEYFISSPFKVKLSGKEVSFFLNAIIKNALLYKNIALAKVLFKITTLQDQRLLLGLLPKSEQEQYIISTKQLTSLQVLEACFANWNGTWSVGFSDKILKETYTILIEQNTFIPEQLAIFMVKHLHPSAISFLQNAKVYPIVSANPYYRNHWEKHFVDAIMKAMEIKQKIYS
ncbi:DUF5691 domain-containing protein [Arcicella aquatica]|uniref:DUF5691 domain-containing protein n=1 Tax=Arcicella aquatica TaxID=217141 RepID=A0ABU5QNA6_9BACT|nr:DUF5691 domain-containing protein [Arcicella aquatica]MEA5258169.1 DUF5691 domain-containing protein [Arcicella aquatica]